MCQEAEELYNQGIDRRNAGDLEGGIAAYKKALEIDPKFHRAWNNLGITLNDLGRYTEAIVAYEKALEIRGDQYWEAWDNRGWEFFKSGRYIEAIQNWDEGLQKYLPSNRDYRLACGNLHQHKGKAHYKYGKQTFTYFESFHKAKASYEQAREFLKSPLIPETYLEAMQGLITVCRSLRDTKTSEYLTEATSVLENLLLDNETHHTGHAYHNTENSEKSALLLGTGEELTLTDILQLKLVDYYLVCLSACETGITKKGELIDEFVGIASGFLPETNYIISTLWRVDERSSALLTIYFYQLWKQGIQPPTALQQAKDWLRELTNGKLGEWYAGELLSLLREAEFDNIFFFEREASRLQKKLAKIDEKP